MSTQIPQNQHPDQISRTLNSAPSLPLLLNVPGSMMDEQNLEQKYQHQQFQNAFNQTFLQPNRQDSSAFKREWKQEEDELVYKLHNEYGNKWAIIAERLKGRTDNCIKNHFYSRLRKGLRKINKLIEDEFKKNFKQFKVIDLYKVIQASDQKFKEVKTLTNQMSDIGHDLKNRLFMYAEQQTQQSEQYKFKVLKIIEDLTDFTKNYKRKSKKSRRYSPMGVDSVYRNFSKKIATQLTQSGEQEVQKNDKSNINRKQAERSIKIYEKIQQIVKIESCHPFVKVQEEIQIKETRPIMIKRESANSQEGDNQILSMLKRQGIVESYDDTSMRKNKNRNKEYRHFSDDEDEQKNEVDYVKEQRLNHFAENILKTFKSYYSFQSFKSNSVMDEPFFP